MNFLGTLLPTQVFSRDMVDKPGAVIKRILDERFYASYQDSSIQRRKGRGIKLHTVVAVHMSKVGIRVNAIAPGFFLTEQNRALLKNEDGTFTERAHKIISQTPMGRFGDKEELIGTLLWLVDDGASGFVNGVVVPVDGGFSAYSGV